MTDAIAQNDLTQALDPARVAVRPGAGNLSLSDQIQFSSILRHIVVDTPEKTLEAARTPKDPADDVLPAQAAILSDDRRTPDRPEDFAPVKVRDLRPQRTDNDADAGRQRSSSQDSGRQDRPDADGRPNVEFDKNAVTQSEVPVRQQSQTQGDDGSGSRLSGQDAAFLPLVAPIIRPADAGVTGTSNANQAAATATQLQTINKPTIGTQAPNNQLASALTDDNFSQVGEDLYTSTLGRNLKEAVKVNTPSAGAALKTHQQADLAQRLGGAPTVINVNVTDDGQSLRVGNSQPLVDGAHLANLDLGDGADNHFLGNGKGQQGANTGANRSGRTPVLRPADIPTGQANPQADAAFQQALNAQVSAAGSSSAAAMAAAGPKAPPVMLDPMSINSATGPSGPSQISQTARANPTTAARHPVPQAPAEQVAVNITKAFGAGADKINIKLHPASLGRVEIKLEIATDGRLSASISAERPETLELLQRDSRILERALQDSGLRTTSDSLSFSLKGENKNAAAQSGDNNGHGSRQDGNDDGNESEQGLQDGIFNNHNMHNRQTGISGGVNIMV